MRSWQLVDGERHAIGRFRQSAASVNSARCAGIRHRNGGCTRSCKVRSRNSSHELVPTHVSGGQCRAIPIDRRSAVKGGAVDRKYNACAARIRGVRNQCGNVRHRSRCRGSGRVRAVTAARQRESSQPGKKYNLQDFHMISPWAVAHGRSLRRKQNRYVSGVSNVCQHFVGPDSSELLKG